MNDDKKNKKEKNEHKKSKSLRVCKGSLLAICSLQCIKPYTANLFRPYWTSQSLVLLLLSSDANNDDACHAAIQIMASALAILSYTWLDSRKLFCYLPRLLVLAVSVCVCLSCFTRWLLAADLAPNWDCKDLQLSTVNNTLNNFSFTDLQTQRE